MFGNFSFFKNIGFFVFRMVTAGIGCDISSQEVYLGLENSKQHTISDKISIYYCKC